MMKLMVVPAILFAAAACTRPDAGPPSASTKSADVAQGPDTIVLIAPDTAEYPGASDSLALHLDYAADIYFHTLDARLEDSLKMTRYLRTDSGLVAVREPSYTSTDIGVITDHAGTTVGAVIATSGFRGTDGYTDYMFDNSGRTSVVEIHYTDGDRPCGADLVHVTARWVIVGGRVASRDRSLTDQDDGSLAPHECALGTGAQITAFTSWPALAKSIGLKQ